MAAANMTLKKWRGQGHSMVLCKYQSDGNYHQSCCMYPFYPKNSGSIPRTSDCNRNCPSIYWDSDREEKFTHVLPSHCSQYQNNVFVYIYFTAHNMWRPPWLIYCSYQKSLQKGEKSVQCSSFVFFDDISVIRNVTAHRSKMCRRTFTYVMYFWENWSVQLQRKTCRLQLKFYFQNVWVSDRHMNRRTEVKVTL